MDVLVLSTNVEGLETVTTVRTTAGGKSEAVVGYILEVGEHRYRGFVGSLQSAPVCECGRTAAVLCILLEAGHDPGLVFEWWQAVLGKQGREVHAVGTNPHGVAPTNRQQDHAGVGSSRRRLANAFPNAVTVEWRLVATPDELSCVPAVRRCWRNRPNPVSFAPPMPE